MIAKYDKNINYIHSKANSNTTAYCLERTMDIEIKEISLGDTCFTLISLKDV